MMSSPPETRASLLLRLPNATEAAAWNEFVSIYGPLVYRLARRRGLRAADADDLVQDVFTSVAKSIARWLDRTDRGRFRAWLFRIARNAALNALTRARIRPVGGDEAAELIAQHPAPAEEASDQFNVEYRRELFRWASEQVRASVAETTWAAFWMSSVEARPIAEVAEELGLSRGRIYVARSRVIARLREVVRQFERQEQE